MFIKKDFFDIDSIFLAQFHIAILNEVIGDFPNVINVDIKKLISNINLDPLERKIRCFFEKYNLPFQGDKIININLGAMIAVEKLCKSGIKYIFISEHSCETEIPNDSSKKNIIFARGTPQRIILKGHDEYTIKFSFLEKIAKKLGYRVLRGQIINYIKIKFSNRINFILRSNTQISDHEIIRQFVNDLFQYEYILLMK